MAAIKSYCHRPLTKTLRHETIPGRLAAIADKFEGKEVYVFLYPDGRRISITARGLYERSRKVAKSLVKLGVQKGDIVALCLLNDLAGLLCNMAVIVAGAIALNTIPAKDDGSDVKRLLAKAGNVSAIIVDPGEGDKQFTACSNLVDTVSAAGEFTSTPIPSLKLFISTRAVKGSGIQGLLTLADVERCETSGVELHALDPEDVCLLLPTSGSTGEPKLVSRTHHEVQVAAFQLEESMEYSETDVVWNERKMAWIGGFPFMLLYCGATTVTKATRLKGLEDHCQFTLDCIRKERCTIAALQPATILGMMQTVERLQGDVPMVTCIHTGGTPVTKACMAAIGKITSKITNCYGSPEGAFMTSAFVTDPSQFEDYETGKPLAGVEVKVVDDEGRVVNKGLTGRIQIRPPSMFRRYYRDTENTSKVLGPTGWFDTDDTGYITANDSLVVNGRRSDTILQGGLYVSPSAIEARIQGFEHTLDVLVVPVPSPEFFQVACVCVVPKPRRDVTADDVRRFYMSCHLASALEPFNAAMPEFLIFDDFPRTHTGKPSKKLLQQEAMKRLGIPAAHS